MNKKDNRNLLTFDTIDWQSGIVNIPKKVLNQLKSQKAKGISVILAKSIADKLEENKIDKKVFEAIKSTQQLPDEVILNFLLAENSLKNTNFHKRIINELNEN